MSIYCKGNDCIRSFGTGPMTHSVYGVSSFDYRKDDQFGWPSGLFLTEKEAEDFCEEYRSRSRDYLFYVEFYIEEIKMDDVVYEDFISKVRSGELKIGRYDQMDKCQPPITAV